ncbi:hypothetical protein V8G54_035503 [Vigna mungo]|uniref:Myb/SANT-like domain-containing protein n=1 Tax=Vigna mungo TaxID=3915 RepID=A0AAQ3MFD6_VIGMU
MSSGRTSDFIKSEEPRKRQKCEGFEVVILSASRWARISWRWARIAVVGPGGFHAGRDLGGARRDISLMWHPNTIKGTQFSRVRSSWQLRPGEAFLHLLELVLDSGSSPFLLLESLLHHFHSIAFDAMIEETRLGNRVDGTWTTQAYINIVQNLHSCGYVAVSKSNVKNRQKVLKDRWHEVHDLSIGLSGFAWNNISMRFEAEDEVWDDLIQWRVNNIRHYDLMVELWAADRAIGSGVDLNQNMEYIPKEPIYRGYTDPTSSSPHPSVDEYSPGQTQFVPSVLSGGTLSSRGFKRKAPMVDLIDAQFDKLATSLDGFINVLGSTNVHFEKISDAVVCKVDAMENRNEILRSQTEILCRIRHSHTQRATYMTLATYVKPSVAKQLDQCRFFSSNHEMEHYVADFYTRNIVEPFYPDLIKVFYSNLKIFGNGYLLSELNVANMKYEGQKLSYANIPDDFPYDRKMTLATMRLNIFNVNAVWQHDVGNDEDEDQAHHHENHVQPPPHLSNPNMMTQMWEGVQDLQHKMQGMKQMQVQIQRIENNLANLSFDTNRQFAHLNQNIRWILESLMNWKKELLNQQDYVQFVNDKYRSWSVEIRC